MDAPGLDPDYVRRLLGNPSGGFDLEATPLRGGLVADAVTRVTARYADADGRRQSRAFVVKVLSGAAVREAVVYEHLAGSDAGAFAPALLAVHRHEDGRCSLYLEAVRPSVRWPWRDVEAARGATRVLAGLHAITPPAGLAATPSDWDYEAELVASASWSLEFVEAAYRDNALEEFRGYMHPLRRVVRELGPMRAHLLGFAPLPPTLIHGDVHPGNVMVRRHGGKDVPVLLDWGRARVGSPLEDVTSWLQSLSYWEPQAMRRHDTLFAEYLSARGMPTRRDAGLRRAYWLAAASNVLAGALRYHVHMATSDEAGAAGRAAALSIVEDRRRVTGGGGIRRYIRRWVGSKRRGESCRM